MNKPKEITKEESDRIRDEWHKAGKPYRPLTITVRGKYFDVRELSVDEVIALIKKHTGVSYTTEELTRSVRACYR